jgi:hypothetical protein
VHAILFSSCGYSHRASGHSLSDAVLDGVLDERLQQETWHLKAAQRYGYIDRDLQPLAKANLLNLKIPLQVFDLLLQRDLRAVRVLG